MRLFLLVLGKYHSAREHIQHLHATLLLKL